MQDDLFSSHFWILLKKFSILRRSGAVSESLSKSVKPLELLVMVVVVVVAVAKPSLAV